jgi:hypothetical protein
LRGIIKSGGGFRAFVKVGNIQREKRFPAETSLKVMQNWRDETRLALRKTKAMPAQAGSL